MKHGERAGNRKTPEYRAWTNMKARCRIKRAYVSRGISVCDRWQNYENFLADMGRRPGPEHSLDRIDNDGHYEPNNCRWATDDQQRNNRSNTHYLTMDSITLTLAQWARRLDIGKTTLHHRIVSGWPVERALTTPVKET